VKSAEYGKYHTRLKRQPFGIVNLSSILRAPPAKIANQDFNGLLSCTFLTKRRLSHKVDPLPKLNNLVIALSTLQYCRKSLKRSLSKAKREATFLEENLIYRIYRLSIVPMRPLGVLSILYLSLDAPSSFRLRFLCNQILCSEFDIPRIGDLHLSS